MSPDGTCSEGNFKLRLREPVDVLSVVPYLLGYHPVNSIVVIGLSDGQLHVTARTDVPVDDNDIAAAADGLQRMLSGVGIDSVIVVAYGDAYRVQALLPRLVTVVERLGVVLLEALRAEDGRYWSYLCRDPSCCPDEGTPFDVRGSRVAAEATLAGISTMPDRAAYESQVRPVTGPAREAMTEATQRAHERLYRMLESATGEDDLADQLVREGATAIGAGLRAQRDGDRLDNDAAAWLSLLVCWAEVRDVAMLRLGEDRADRMAARDLWLDILRRAEPDLVPAPGILFALAAGRRGELVLAQLAIERVLEAEPLHPMARLIDTALLRGLPPTFDVPDLSTVERPRPARVKRPRGPRPRKRSSSRRAGSPPT
jgi:hypothetical protein